MFIVYESIRSAAVISIQSVNKLVVSYMASFSPHCIITRSTPSGGTESESDRDDSFKLTIRAELQINI